MVIPMVVKGLATTAARVTKPVADNFKKVAGVNEPKKPRKFKEVLANDLDETSKGGKEFVGDRLDEFIEKHQNDKGELGVETPGAKLSTNSNDGNPIKQAVESLEDEISTEKLKKTLGVHENFDDLNPKSESGVLSKILSSSALTKIKGLPVKTSGVAFLLFIIILILFTLQKTETGETRISLIFKTILNKTTLKDAPVVDNGVTGVVNNIGYEIGDAVWNTTQPISNGIVGVGEYVGNTVGDAVKPFTDYVGGVIGGN